MYPEKAAACYLVVLMHKWVWDLLIAVTSWCILNWFLHGG